MREIKRMSTTEVAAIIGSVVNSPRPVAWRGREIYINTTVEPQTYFDIIRKVLSDTFDSNGEPHIEYVDYYIRYHVISNYCYLDMPKTFEQIYYLLYSSGLYELVCQTANKGQLDSIRDIVYGSL